MAPIKAPKEFVGENSSIPLEILPDNYVLIRRLADDLLSEYLAAKAAGRGEVIFSCKEMK
jgi:hypothetical protein